METNIGEIVPVSLLCFLRGGLFLELIRIFSLCDCEQKRKFTHEA